MLPCVQCENPQTCVPLGCVLGAPASQRREAATSGATVTGAHPFTVQSIELVVRHFEPKKCTGSGAASTFSTLSFQELLRPILSNPDVRQTAGGFFRKSKFHRASVALGSVLSGGIVHFTHPFSVIINLRQSISSRARLHFSTCSGAKRA